MNLHLFKQATATALALLLISSSAPAQQAGDKVDLDVLAQIKAEPATRATPVVIMSSSDQESDMVKGLSLYANSYIVKPVDFRQFTEQVSLLGKYWMQVNRVG